MDLDRSPERPGFVLRVLGTSRYLVALAVLGSFLSALVLLVYGTLAVAEIGWDTLRAGEVSVDGAKYLAVDLVEMTDVFLLGTVLIIVALGLYELFIDPALPVPDWLRIRDLDELKGKLVGVVGVLLGVTFLGYVVEWKGNTEILHLGVAIALVIGALSVSTAISQRSHAETTPSDDTEGH